MKKSQEVKMMWTLLGHSRASSWFLTSHEERHCLTIDWYHFYDSICIRTTLVEGDNTFLWSKMQAHFLLTMKDLRGLPLGFLFYFVAYRAGRYQSAFVPHTLESGTSATKTKCADAHVVHRIPSCQPLWLT